MSEGKNDFVPARHYRTALSEERKMRVATHKARFNDAASVFRKARQFLGLSQVEAALRLGTSQAGVSKLEKRESPNIGQLEKLVAGTEYEVVVLLRSKDSAREIALSA